MALFKQVKTVVNVALDPQDQRLEIESVLRFFRLLEKLIHKLHALGIFLADEKDVNQPIRLLSLIQSLVFFIEDYRLTIDEHGCATVLGTPFFGFDKGLWNRRYLLIEVHVIINFLGVLSLQDVMPIFKFHYYNF